MRRLALFLLLLLPACGTADPAGPTPTPAPATPTRSPARPEMDPSRAGPISEPEALDYGQELARALTQGDAPAVLAAFDYDRFLDRVVRGIPLKPQDLKGFRKGFLETARRNPGGLMHGMVGQRARMLRYHQAHGEPRVLLRLLLGKSPPALAYLDVTLERDASGAVRATDFYSWATGEPVSETLRRTVLPALAQLSRTPLERLLTGPTATQDFQKLVDLSGKVQAGQPEEVLKLFRTLPENLKRNKVVLLTVMQAAMNSGDDKAYLDSLERFKLVYPKDPALRLHLVDYRYLRGEIELVPQALDALEGSLGVEDPYLNVMRASALMEARRYEAALALGRKAVQQEPDLEEAHWAVVNVSLERKDYAAVAAGLEGLRRFYPEELQAFVKGDPAYADFLKSPEGAKWLK